MVEGRADGQIAIALRKLTLRQRETYDFLVRTYLTHKEIAAAMGKSESAVKQHSANIYRKFNVRSRIQLMNIVNPRAGGFLGGGE